MNKSIPQQIAIEINNTCNLRCSGCMQSLGYKKQENMTFEFFKSIIDRNTFGATIMPFMNNEPLLHPDIYKMMKYVIEKEQRCYLTTNGMIYNQNLYELMTQKNSCYQIVISLDGLPGSKSIKMCRPGSEEEIIIHNIFRFLALKQKNGNNIDVCIKICQRGQDWEEIEEFIYLWLSYGVDYVCVGKMLNQSGLELRKFPCQYFDNKFMLIRADHRAVPCMYCYDVSINDYFQIGELDEKQDLIEFYNNDVYTRLRENQNQGIFGGPCKTCSSAYTGHGFRGKFQFNDKSKKNIGTIYSSLDYYNQTFSLRDKAKGVQFENI